jgi:hypothetical protein
MVADLELVAKATERALLWASARIHYNNTLSAPLISVSGNVPVADIYQVGDFLGPSASGKEE